MVRALRSGHADGEDWVRKLVRVDGRRRRPDPGIGSRQKQMGAVLADPPCVFASGPDVPCQLLPSRGSRFYGVDTGRSRPRQAWKLGVGWRPDRIGGGLATVCAARGGASFRLGAT